ncbi:hypothetical protein C7T94_08325 [Pedobacter yulinensis]|uniref:SnoaL-like domain-containing protein n=1 Tax=Pedobacter yulinensis TaxID=2126353 RepID=A0A2T3HJP0_9SPHI|nr:nuclear transport factor 2 family protein [Pedobacter yulinensis]PST82657.1 hypothetical protein C7T94_08325 [Pedobacter yulinensis]
MSNTHAITKDFLHYLQQRNLEKLMNLFADEVKWEIPGDVTNIKWLGVRKNKPEIRDFFEMLWKETEPVSGEIATILYDDHNVIIKGAFTTRMLKTGKVVSSLFFIHFTVLGDKIVEYTLLEDSYAVSQALLDI